MVSVTSSASVLGSGEPALWPPATYVLLCHPLFPNSWQQKNRPVPIWKTTEPWSHGPGTIGAHQTDAPPHQMCNPYIKTPQLMIFQNMSGRFLGVFVKRDQNQIQHFVQGCIRFLGFLIKLFCSNIFMFPYVFPIWSEIDQFRITINWESNRFKLFWFQNPSFNLIVWQLLFLDIVIVVVGLI